MRTCVCLSVGHSWRLFLYKAKRLRKGCTLSMGHHMSGAPGLQGGMRRTAVHWACQGGHVQMVELLMEFGADTKVPCRSLSHFSCAQLKLMTVADLW